MNVLDIYNYIIALVLGKNSNTLWKACFLFLEFLFIFFFHNLVLKILKIHVLGLFLKCWSKYFSLKFKSSSP